VRNVVTELRGEKIDVVPWSADAAALVANALQPAKVKEARVDPETQTALVIVPDYQLSLAIGKEGQNARLAARLTGWRIDIKSETQFADEQRAPKPAPVAPAAEAALDAPAADEEAPRPAEEAPEVVSVDESVSVPAAETDGANDVASADGTAAVEEAAEEPAEA
jgi:N utilization substance protein A